MEKKLLFITSRLLWPVDGGRKMSLNYYCKGLYEQFGYDIYLYCFLEAGQKYNGKHPSFIKEVYIAEDVTNIEKIRNIFFKTFGPSKWPLQCSLYFSRRNEEQIRKICSEIRPNVVFTEMIRTATYYDAFMNPEIVSIANLDDLLSKRYFRQARSNKSKASAAGAYAGKLPSFVNKIILNSVVNHTFLRYEARHCQKWEKRFYDLYDYSMFTSSLEAEEINKEMKAAKARTLSVGIDYELFARPIADLVKEKNSISYVGNFQVAANRDTLRMICEEILPLVKSNCKLYVIGSCPDDIKAEYASDRIVFTGRVEDLAEYIRKTEVFFSPIAYGTGIKTKIVEAMAMGMPVVTNDVGTEGIGGVNGKHYVVANNPVDLANQLDELLNENSKIEAIGQSAQQFSYEHFRWEVVYKSFSDIGL